MTGDQEVVLLALVMTAKFSSTYVFCVIYLHTSEIYPTVVRAASMGLFITCSRIGAVFAPVASIYMVLYVFVRLTKQ